MTPTADATVMETGPAGTATAIGLPGAAGKARIPADPDR